MFWHRASESLVDPFDKNKCAHFNEIFSEHIECNVDIAYLKKKIECQCSVKEQSSKAMENQDI